MRCIYCPFWNPEKWQQFIIKLQDVYIWVPDCIHVVSNLLVGLKCASSKFFVVIVQETFENCNYRREKRANSVDTNFLNEYRVAFP